MAGYLKSLKRKTKETTLQKIETEKVQTQQSRFSIPCFFSPVPIPFFLVFVVVLSIPEISQRNEQTKYP